MGRRTKNKDFLKTLGARVKQIRVNAGLTQTALSVRTGMTPPTISRIESGIMSVAVSSLPLLANALGVPVHSLFEENDLPLINTDMLNEADRELISLFRKSTPSIQTVILQLLRANSEVNDG